MLSTPKRKKPLKNGIDLEEEGLGAGKTTPARVTMVSSSDSDSSVDVRRAPSKKRKGCPEVASMTARVDASVSSSFRSWPLAEIEAHIVSTQNLLTELNKLKSKTEELGSRLVLDEDLERLNVHHAALLNQRKVVTAMESVQNVVREMEEEKEDDGGDKAVPTAVSGPSADLQQRLRERFKKSEIVAATTVSSDQVAVRILIKAVAKSGIFLYFNVDGHDFTYRHYVDKDASDDFKIVSKLNPGHFWLVKKGVTLKPPVGNDAYGIASTYKGVYIAKNFLNYSGDRTISEEVRVNTSPLTDVLALKGIGNKGEKAIKDLAFFSFSSVPGQDLVRFECVECMKTVKGKNGRCEEQHTGGTKARWVVSLEFVDYKCRHEDCPDLKLVCTAWSGLDDLFRDLPDPEPVMLLEPGERKIRANQIITDLAMGVIVREDKLRVVVYYDGGTRQPSFTLKRVFRN